MKKPWLTCLMLASVACALHAQVKKAGFKAAIHQFGLFIDSHNYGPARDEMGTLGGMMSAQMTYLNSAIIIMQKKYTADTASAAADMKNAQSSPDANSTQTVSAHYEVKRAAAAFNRLNNARNKLAAETAVYNSIQPLLKNLTANRKAIIRDLDKFAKTL